MQEHVHSQSAPDTPGFRERRKDTRKRDVVARGAHAGRDNVLSGVEYLQARGIEAHIIRRVLMRLLTGRRAFLQAQAAPSAPLAMTAREAKTRPQD